MAEQAAALLGWRGHVLPAMSLLGRSVAVIAEILPAAHAERIATGAEPQTDRVTVGTWCWRREQPAGAVPPQAVRIHGVLSAARHWRTAMAAAGAFRAICRTGLVIPQVGADDPDCVARAAQLGFAVIAAGDDGKLAMSRPADDEQGARSHAGQHGGPCCCNESARWVNELVYERLLATAE